MKHKIKDIKEAAKILGLSLYETSKSVEKKYKELIKLYHPDVNKEDSAKANEKASQINRAYEIINDYLNEYVFSFGNAELERYNPHDAELEKMRRDTTWGA